MSLTTRMLPGARRDRACEKGPRDTRKLDEVLSARRLGSESDSSAVHKLHFQAFFRNIFICLVRLFVFNGAAIYTPDYILRLGDIASVSSPYIYIYICFLSRIFSYSRGYSTIFNSAVSSHSRIGGAIDDGYPNRFGSDWTCSSCRFVHDKFVDLITRISRWYGARRKTYCRRRWTLAPGGLSISLSVLIYRHSIISFASLIFQSLADTHVDSKLSVLVFVFLSVSCFICNLSCVCWNNKLLITVWWNDKNKTR